MGLIPPGFGPRACTPFGAGIGRAGDLCGALTGALVVYGAARGREDPGDLEGKERAYAHARRMYERFRVRARAVRCREITRVDFGDPASAERYKAEDMHDRICRPLVGYAAELTFEALVPDSGGSN